MQVGRPRLALRPLRPHRRPLPDPLRAARVAVRQRALRAAVEPRPRAVSRGPGTPTTRAPDEAGADVFPFVVTSYRLTEHHTAGGMTRTVAATSTSCSRRCSARSAPSLPPSGASSTAAGRRSSPRGRRSRRGCWSPSGCGPCGCRAASSTRSACPTTGASAAPARATRPTTCSRIALDPNVHIQEVKAATCDIVAGRRPRGPALPEFVASLPRAGRIAGELMAGQRSDAGGRTTRPSPARRLLHRHQRLHRLQGLRGRLQGVERGAGRKRGLDRHLLRQQRRPRRQPLAPRRLHRAARRGRWRRGGRPGFVGRGGLAPATRRRRAADTQRRRRLPLADELRRLQALHRGRLPRRLPDRLDLPHRARHGRRPGGHLQRLRLLRRRLPVRGPRPAPGRRPRLEVHPLLRPPAGRHDARLRAGLPDRVDPVRRARGAARAGRRAGRAAAGARRRGRPAVRGR